MKNTNQSSTPSEARIHANRENAQKSTGPRTAEGKAASSRNRLLHGLRANKHILLDEDPEDFLFLLKDLHDRFQPVGDGEERLVLRIASAQWRLDRTFPMEASLYRNRLHEIAEEEADRQRTYAREVELAAFEGFPTPPAPTPRDDLDLLARAFDADCVAPNSLARLARYEGSIERSIDRCLRQLKTYQAARIASTPTERQPEPPDEAAEDPEPPAEPATTPSNSDSCHSNPINGGIAVAVAVSPLPHALPQFISALKTNILQRFRAALSPRPLLLIRCLSRPRIGGRAILPAAGF
jgi:hypothetical protein